MDCQHELQNQRQKAYEYYMQTGIPKVLEDLLNNMYYDNPEDMYAYLSNSFESLARPPIFTKIASMPILDGRGNLAVQTFLHCIITAKEKLVTQVSVSLNALEGPNIPIESIVQLIVSWINSTLSVGLQGCDFTDRRKTDSIITELLAELTGIAAAGEPTKSLTSTPNLLRSENEKGSGKAKEMQIRGQRNSIISKQSQDMTGLMARESVNSSMLEESSVLQKNLWKIKAIASWCASTVWLKSAAVLSDRSLHSHVRHVCNRNPTQKVGARMLE